MTREGNSPTSARLIVTRCGSSMNACLYVQDDRRRWWVEIADGTGRTLLTVLYPNAYALAFAAAIDWRRAWFTYASFKG
jgi:hypothetical protein